MAIAGVIVNTRAVDVEAAKAILEAEGVQIEDVNDKFDIVGVMEAPSLQALQRKCDELCKKPEILGIYPAYVTAADEDGTADDIIVKE